MNNEKNETENIVSNDAVRGKPYLDIDRVITEAKAPVEETNNEQVFYDEG